MDRRRFLVSTPVATLMASMPTTSFAMYRFSEGVGSAYIDTKKIQSVGAFQQTDVWCWAASISMIFDFYGYKVSQESIVKELFGQIVVTTGQWFQILALLNHTWTDDEGRRFRSSTTSYYSNEGGNNTLTNQAIVDNLIKGLPLFLCNTTHAMVLTAVKYVPTGDQPRILEGWVLDPWPLNGSVRKLPPVDMRVPQRGGRMNLLALISVTSLGGTPADEPSPSDDEDPMADYPIFWKE